MKYKNLGCYNAVDEIGMNPAISELLFNEVSPRIDKFNGHMLKFNDTWQTQYLQLLCRCARVAEEKGYEVFAIRNKGMSHIRLTLHSFLLSCIVYKLVLTYIQNLKRKNNNRLLGYYEK